jgi:GntR family transcriptional regulator
MQTIEWKRAIDRSSPIPYYYQLQEMLKQEIEAGHWTPGELLPSEGDLETALGVSRTVIRQALAVLEADGQVFRVKGKGTIVAQPKFRYEAVHAAGDWAVGSASEEIVVGAFLDVRRVEAGSRVGRLLGVGPAESVLEMTVVHAVGERSIALIQAFLRADASPDLTRLGDDLPELRVGGVDMLLQLGHQYGLVIARSLLTIEGTLANEFEANALGIRQGAAVFLLSSVDEDADGRPVMFSRSIVPVDRAQFAVAVTRSRAAGPSGAAPYLSVLPAPV